MNETRTNGTTLRNAGVQRNYKDTVFDFELLLYEHQSTCNPNMPLRDLLYVSRVLQNRIRNENLYSKSLVRIPAPRFVVFYNGTDVQPEQQTLCLSDAFEKRQEEPSLELSVTVYNINPGYNRELLEACRLLREYAQYVEHVRSYTEELPLSEAVEKAVDDCIRNGILNEFLSRNRAEAIEVSIFEYDEEKHMRSERKEWREIGREEGRSEGREEGRAEGLKEGHAEGLKEGHAEGLKEGHAEGHKAGQAEGLKKGYAEGLKASFDMLKTLMEEGNTEEIKRALSDSDYQEQLCQKYFSEHE